MEDLSVSIPNESLGLLSKQKHVINRRQKAKKKVNDFLHKQGNSWDVKNIPANEFENSERIQKAIKEVNNTIGTLASTQEEKKRIQAQELEVRKQIQSLESTSKIVTWLVIIGVVVIAYFYLTN